jgi:hypothetical protein
MIFTVLGLAVARNLRNFDFPKSCCARSGESKRQSCCVSGNIAHVDVYCKKCKGSFNESVLSDQSFFYFDRECQKFRQIYRDDYFRVGFDHFSIERHFWSI